MTYPQADSALVRHLWIIIKCYQGYENRINRDSLTFIVFGKNSPSLDRKVRDALAELPVVWDDGYFVPTSYDEAESYIAGMRSRQAAIGQRLRILDDYLRVQHEPVKLEQMTLEV